MPVYGFSFRPVRREHRVEGLALPLLVNLFQHDGAEVVDVFLAYAIVQKEFLNLLREGALTGFFQRVEDASESV